jgi:hypothetical protein
MVEVSARAAGRSEVLREVVGSVAAVYSAMFPVKSRAKGWMQRVRMSIATPSVVEMWLLRLSAEMWTRVMWLHMRDAMVTNVLIRTGVWDWRSERRLAIVAAGKLRILETRV